MTPTERGALSQAERRFDELVEQAAAKGLLYRETDAEWESEVESLRDFGNTRGPCTPRTMPR